MSLKIYSTVDKLVAKDQRIVQQAGDTDGVIASFYDLSGNPSLFMNGSLIGLGNVGIKTTTPNEALTVVGNVSSNGYFYGNLTLPKDGTISSSGSSQNIYINGNLIPTASAFYLGDKNNPIAGIYLAAHTLYIASATPGVSGIGLSNENNVLTVTTGGLRSSEIYTGGLFISGNNIGADPAATNLPMTIGTSGLPAVQILVPMTVNSSVSAHSLSGTHYGDGSHLLNLPTSNPFNQSLNTTNNVVFSSLSLMDGLTAHYTTIIGDLSCTGRIYAADVHAPLSVSDLTTTTKTLALSDVNSIVTGSSTSDMTITIPLNSTVPFPIGTEIKFIQLGTKKITIAATSGVNLANNSNQYKTKGQHAVIWLFQVTSDQWILTGDTSA